MRDDDLVARARRYAEQAHNAIDHRRKREPRMQRAPRRVHKTPARG